MSEKAIFGQCELSLYKDIYSLIAVREYNNKYYQQWCRLEFGKEKNLSEKSFPVKIILGGPNEAVATLVEIIHAITGEWYEPRKENTEKGIPF